MRLAYVVERYPAVSETFIARQVSEALRRGHDVDIFPVTVGDEGDLDPALPHLVRARLVPPVPTARSRSRRAISALGHARRLPLRTVTGALNVVRWGRQAGSLRLLHECAQFAGNAYDLVHCHFGRAGLRALRARSLGALRGPLLTTFHGMDLTHDPRVRGPLLYERLFAEGEAFTVNSAFLEGVALRLGCPADRLERLPMAIDVGQFPFRARGRVGSRPVRVLTVGRLVESKGIEYSVRAMARLLRTGIEIEFRIVGDGPLRGRLEDLVRTEGAQAAITLIGALRADEVRREFNWADLFVLSGVEALDGRVESQGIVLLEAQAVGLPVLTTRVGGAPESVDEGGSAVIVRPRQVDELMEALRDLILAPERWGEMGRRGRSYVERGFDASVWDERLMALYERTAGRAK